MTAQEIFTTVVLAMNAQGRPSITFMVGKKGQRHALCRYRGPDDCKCALGVLIDDETAVRMEGKSIEGFDKAAWDAHPHLKPHHSLLESLQFAHDGPILAGFDGPKWLEEFTRRAAIVAVKHKLVMS